MATELTRTEAQMSRELGYFLRELDAALFPDKAHEIVTTEVGKYTIQDMETFVVEGSYYIYDCVGDYSGTKIVIRCDSTCLTPERRTTILRRYNEMLSRDAKSWHTDGVVHALLSSLDELADRIIRNVEG